MPVANPRPITIPPVSQKVFDKLWISKIHIDSPVALNEAKFGIDGLTKLFVELIPYREVGRDKEAKEFLVNSPVILNFSDLFSMAAVDSELAGAMQLVMLQIQKLAEKKLNG